VPGKTKTWSQGIIKAVTFKMTCETAKEMCLTGNGKK